MSQSSTQKTLLGCMAACATVTLAILLWAFGSKPDNWHHRIEAQISGDGKTAFWYEHDNQLLRVVDLELYQIVLEKRIKAKSWAWAPDNQTLHFIQTKNKFHHFGWMPVNGGASIAGPKAGAYITPHPGIVPEVYLLGNGDYRNASAYQIRSFSKNSEQESDVLPIFGGSSHSHTGYSGGRVSPDGSLVAIGVWGYNSPDGLEVWNFAEKNCVLQHDEEASFVFFTPDNSGLLTVESTAARVQLHRFDLKKGELIDSSDSLHGSAVAECSPDFRRVAIGRVSYDNNIDHFEIFSAESLEKKQGIRLPGERFLLHIHFDPAREGQLEAIGRSGVHWRWDMASATKPEMAGRLVPKYRDDRWRKAIWSGLAFALFAGLALLDKKQGKASVNSSPPESLLPQTFFWVLIGLETLKWIANFSMSIGNISTITFFSMIHCGMGVTAMIFLIFASLFRLEMQWKWVIPSVLLLFISGLIDLWFIATAIASI